MTSFVAAERLVRRESLVTYTALVCIGVVIIGEYFTWFLAVDRGGRGGGATASKHDETEGEILFFRRRRSLGTGSFRALLLHPWLRIVKKSGGSAGASAVCVVIEGLVVIEGRRGWDFG